MSLRFQIPITKTEKLEDGRLLVAGLMTNETLDSQGDILDYDGQGDGGSKEAVTFWEGNLREAHKATEPVGRKIAMVPNDKERSIYVETFVSKGAPNTQEKVLDETLRYFSVGGDAPEKFKIEKRDGKDIRRVLKWKMRELSLVDVGANRDAAFQVLVKADGTVTDLLADEPPAAVVPPSADPPPHDPGPNRLAEKLLAAVAKGKPPEPVAAKVDNVVKSGNADDGGDGYAAKKCEKCDQFHKEGIAECNTKADAADGTQKADPPPPEKPPTVKAYLAKHYGAGEESDIARALALLDGLAEAAMSELAEGEAGDASLLKEAIDLIRQYLANEAQELVEGADEEALEMGPQMLALARASMPMLTKEVSDAFLKGVREALAGIQKQEAPEPPKDAITKADVDNIVEAVGVGLREVTNETSQALGEIKAELGDLKAMREQVAKMAKQPAMPAPPVRFLAPGVGPQPAGPNSGEAAAATLLKWASSADPQTRAYLERAASLERTP